MVVVPVGGPVVVVPVGGPVVVGGGTSIPMQVVPSLIAVACELATRRMSAVLAFRSIEGTRIS